VETFVIRIWTPAQGEEGAKPLALRGLAEHVGSGTRSAFREPAELLSFLEKALTHRDREVER
jgi:hypothetical protein